MMVAGLIAIFAACSGGAGDSKSDVPNTLIDSTAPAASNLSTPLATRLGIDFTAILLDGSPVTLSEQLALRPVALWFWAPG